MSRIGQGTSRAHVVIGWRNVWRMGVARRPSRETRYRVSCTGSNVWPGVVTLRFYWTFSTACIPAFSYLILDPSRLTEIGSSSRGILSYSELFRKRSLCACRIVQRTVVPYRRCRISGGLQGVV